MRKIWKEISDKKIHSIWNEKNIDKKKEMILDIVYNFVHKNKQRDFIYGIHKPSYDKCGDLDKMVCNLKLIVEGHRVR